MILKNIKKDLFWTSWATPNINESNLKLNKQLFWEDSLIQNKKLKNEGKEIEESIENSENEEKEVENEKNEETEVEK